MAPVNKARHVRTIALVAGAINPDQSVLLIHFIGNVRQPFKIVLAEHFGDDGVMAFTDFGIETLTGLIEIYKAGPDLLKRWPPDPK